MAACRLRSGGSLFGTGDDLGLGAGPRWRPRVHDCDRGVVDRAARLAAAASPPRRREGDLDARLRLPGGRADRPRSEEHTSELQSLMRISYAVFCLKKNIKKH